MNVDSNTKINLRDYWQTSELLVKQIENILSVSFVLDPCAAKENHKAPIYITETENGLEKDWFHLISVNKRFYNFINSATFINPPFSNISDWIDKIIEESQKGLTIVLIHPDSHDTAWFQKIEKNCLLQLVPTKRINFIDPETQKLKTGINFPTCISVFNGFPCNSVQRIRFVPDV